MQTRSSNQFLTAVALLLFVIVVGLLLILYVPLNDDQSETIISGPVESTDSDDIPEEIAVDQEWPLLFATMTHMEGGWEMAAINEAFFSRQADLLRTAMDYAEMYDAVLTFETEIPFAEGMAVFDDNVFQEALDRGMGIGTHCDITPGTRFSVDEIITEFFVRKQAVDALVDSSENIGCAGGGGLGDWYVGAVGAGFAFLDGLVGFHYLAMPEALRPDGWDNRAIMSEHYHTAAPVEDELRYYPFRVSEASFEEDPEGELVISAGDIGQIASIGDLVGQEGWEAECGQDCTIDQDDVDAIVAEILAFDAVRDRSRPAKMQVYIPSAKYDEEAVELFFIAMQELQEEGVIEWASQKQVYETFLEWENSQMQ